MDKLGSTEVDFVAKKQGAYTYYQVTADMTVEATFDQEIRPLEHIQDNDEKIFLIAGRLTIGNYNGIKVKDLLDWLLESEISFNDSDKKSTPHSKNLLCGVFSLRGAYCVLRLTHIAGRTSFPVYRTPTPEVVISP